MKDTNKCYKTYKMVPSGDCPFNILDVDDMKPECASHVHFKWVVAPIRSEEM